MLETLLNYLTSVLPSVYSLYFPVLHTVATSLFSRFYGIRFKVNTCMCLSRSWYVPCFSVYRIILSTLITLFLPYVLSYFLHTYQVISSTFITFSFSLFLWFPPYISCHFHHRYHLISATLIKSFPSYLITLFLFTHQVISTTVTY